jgi:hypothetical protein
MAPSHRDFVDPRPGLEAEYEAARAKLRESRGEPRSMSQQLSLWFAELRLHREKVSKPLRIARW